MSSSVFSGESEGRNDKRKSERGSYLEDPEDFLCKEAWCMKQRVSNRNYQLEAGPDAVESSEVRLQLA